jgi:hypothetical protein
MLPHVMEDGVDRCPVCGCQYETGDFEDIITSPDGYVYDQSCEGFDCFECGASLVVHISFSDDEVVYSISEEDVS